MWTRSGDVGTNSAAALEFCDDDFDDGSPRKTDFRSMLKDMVSCGSGLLNLLSSTLSLGACTIKLFTATIYGFL